MQTAEEFKQFSLVYPKDLGELLAANEYVFVAIAPSSGAQPQPQLMQLLDVNAYGIYIYHPSEYNPLGISPGFYPWHRIAFIAPSGLDRQAPVNRFVSLRRRQAQEDNDNGE